MVFVSGDAGVGKTALVKGFSAVHGSSARVLVGTCDGLRTPRPLGPFIEIAGSIGGTLDEAFTFDALLDDLAAHGETIVLLEDAHWADEATLDVLGMLGRRIESVPAL